LSSADFQDEVNSWELMIEALHLEDRQEIREMFRRASVNKDALSRVKSEFQSEAFLMLLILENQKLIEYLATRLNKTKAKQN
jgi:hypothetical protein